MITLPYACYGSYNRKLPQAEIKKLERWLAKRFVIKLEKKP